MPKKSADEQLTQLLVESIRFMAQHPQRPDNLLCAVVVATPAEGEETKDTIRIAGNLNAAGMSELLHAVLDQMESGEQTLEHKERIALPKRRGDDGEEIH